MARSTNITPGMCTRGRTLTHAALSPDAAHIAVAMVDGAGGRLVLIPVPVKGDDASPEHVIAADPPVAVQPGCFVWTPDGTHLVYVATDKRLCIVPITGGPGRTIVHSDEPIAAPAISPDGTRVAYVVDTHHIDSAPLARTAAPTRHTTTADFAMDPTWSADGALAWHEWHLPHMPWDHTRIVQDNRTAAEGGALQQPRFSPDGRHLAYLSDATGWLNLHVDGRPVLDEPFEHGDPAWGPGQHSFCWSPDSTRIALNRNEAGFGRLLTIDLSTGHTTELGKAVHRSLSWSGDRIAAIRSGARTPTQLVVYNTEGQPRRNLAHGPVAGFEPALVEPEPVTWEGVDGTTIHGRLYRPVAPLSDPPPLIVDIHGGPTGQYQAIFDPKAAFFLDRGWAILAPDPRGSTGWGRAYQQALRTHWGDLDTEDVAAGMRAAARNGWADPARMVPRGGSSGGMTVLLLLARHPDLCAAGLASYPVADLADLATSTYRFEAHYTWSLIGPWPETKAEHEARSPLAHADRITKPLLVFHGTADEVVPIAQSRALAARVPHLELVEYEGEGHGLRQPANVEDQLRRSEAFLAEKVLGFSE
jgi:dipeptidyl aminopeptidase/acylaminoacyl peptidase